jgi:hypothetical protein
VRSKEPSTPVLATGAPAAPTTLAPVSEVVGWGGVEVETRVAVPFLNTTPDIVGATTIVDESRSSEQADSSPSSNSEFAPPVAMAPGTPGAEVIVAETVVPVPSTVMPVSIGAEVVDGTSPVGSVRVGAGVYPGRKLGAKVAVPS